MGFLDNIDKVDAKEAGGTGAYFGVGDYIVQITDVKQGFASTDGKEFFVLEGEYVHLFDNPPADARVGKAATYFCGYRFPKEDVPLVKNCLIKCLSAALIQKGLLAAGSEIASEQFTSSQMKMIFDQKLLVGAKIRVSGFQKGGKPFTHYKWSVPGADVLALVGTQPRGFSLA